MDIPPDVITPASLHQATKHKFDPPSSGSKNNQVSTVILYGIPIVSLVIETQERLCLAQISNTLLKEFSYNEIHNRRVALGITCVQCTPVQLEILRRAGAMPVSSRRCGMITRREAERLCKSFLGDNSPPRLPEDFAFSVHHECAWGCRGSFLPSRYNSSRAKCIKCAICGLFFSPNKFIFHSHRLSTSAKYVQPDAANFNSWRRHMKLLGAPPDEVVHAWEDVKAMFNGGTRKRVNSSPSRPTSRSAPISAEAKVKVTKVTTNDLGHPLNNNKEIHGFNQMLPSALSRISALPNLDFWHGHPTAANVPNAVGLKSFPSTTSVTFPSMSALAAAAMLPAWYYNYTSTNTSTCPSPNSSAFRPVYPAYLSSYLTKLSPRSDVEEGDEGGGGDEDSDEMVDIETCTPEDEFGGAAGVPVSDKKKKKEMEKEEAKEKEEKEMEKEIGNEKEKEEAKEKEEKKKEKENEKEMENEEKEKEEAKEKEEKKKEKENEKEMENEEKEKEEAKEKEEKKKKKEKEKEKKEMEKEKEEAKEKEEKKKEKEMENEEKEEAKEKEEKKKEKKKEEKDTHLAKVRTSGVVPKKRTSFQLKSASLWSIDKMTSPSNQSHCQYVGTRNDAAPSPWLADQDGGDVPIDCSTCHHAATIFNNNNNNIVKEQSQN
ncbi:hypothetical protein M8J75_002923 [Diaphorina citri]|nr:hypothetical protein M8J75_002923 [Diaphorina citri]